jgi:hypothetical protein
LQSFIEIYINGRKGKIVEKDSGNKGKGALVSMKNFSLLSDNSTIDPFLSETAKILKNISTNKKSKIIT